MFVSVLSEDSDCVTDGSSLSRYLWLSAMPGHFVWLPKEKGYTADLLQCNQTWRESLELHDPRASFSCILQSSSWIWVWAGEKCKWEKPVKSYKICPWNNQRPNQFVQRPREAGGLQRNVWSGRSLSVHPSPYLRQTHNQSSGEKRWLGGMGLRRGTKTVFIFLLFFLVFVLSFCWMSKCT